MHLLTGKFLADFGKRVKFAIELFRMTESGPRPARYRLTVKGIEPVEERRARKRLAQALPANALPI